MISNLYLTKVNNKYITLPLIKNLSILPIIKFLHNINFYLYIYFYFFSYLNLFNFFNKIYLNLNYFYLFKFINNKKNYLFYYIQFKKQNSLLKKKYNFINTLNPIFFKKNMKKNMTNKTDINKKSLFYLYNNIFFNKNADNINKFNTINGKKKLKKTILLNRTYYRYLNNNFLKNSKKVNKKIFLQSKEKLNFNLLAFQYSLVNILQNINLFKSTNDLKQLILNKKILVNRKISSSLNTVLDVGSIVEISINYKIFNYIFKFKQVFNKNLIKLRAKLWFKFKNNFK